MHHSHIICILNKKTITIPFEQFSSEKHCRKEGTWAGHLISGYSLPMEDPGQTKSSTASENIGGTWREAITVAFEATKAAFPGGEILAHLDHK